MKDKTFYTALISIIISTIIVCIVLVYIFTGNNLGKMDNKNTQLTNEIKEMMQNKSNSLALLKTNYGDIYIELYTQKSPITAGNFKELVEDGFYDNVKFHRVIPNFMIQGGDPLTKNDSLQNRWGTGGPGYTIEDEFIQGLSNTRGTLSMANSGPQSGGSQFFINTVDNKQLDFNKQPLSSKHPVFGKVISGMDVVDEISNVARNQRDVPNRAVVIEEAIIIE